MFRFRQSGLGISGSASNPAIAPLYSGLGGGAVLQRIPDTGHRPTGGRGVAVALALSPDHPSDGSPNSVVDGGLHVPDGRTVNRTTQFSHCSLAAIDRASADLQFVLRGQLLDSGRLPPVTA